jgi:1-acyl-sn-glycerol-3-phosphate acyltransferase
MANPLRGAHEALVYAGTLAILSILSFAWSTCAWLLWPVLPERVGIVVGRRAIMTGFRFYAWLLSIAGAYRFDLEDLSALRDAPPMILAPNHPTLLDAPVILGRVPNLVCVMKASVGRNPLFGGGARLARYVSNDSPRQMIRESVEALRRGGHLLLFPEGTRTARAPINTLGGGIGAIAQRAGVPIQTLLIETDSPFLGKRWQPTRPPRLPIQYRARLGRRFAPCGDPAGLVADLEAYFRAALGGSATPGESAASAPAERR